MPFLFQIVRRLGAGLGRDFCVGDIHGCFHLVKQALDAVNFDPTVDRLFCVGDLVDRGPYSELALEFLREPWVFAIRGNHEQMVLDLYADGELDEAALAFNVARNGMGWWLQTPLERRAALLEEFSKLPVAMEVTTARGLVGMVHAEVPLGMDWPTFVANLEARDPHTLQSALWGRVRATKKDTRGVLGIDRLFAGHTPQLEGAQRLGNVYLLDSGAVFGAMGDAGKLSMANLVCGTAMLATPQVPTPLVELYPEAVEGPFGRYAVPPELLSSKWPLGNWRITLRS